MTIESIILKILIIIYLVLIVYNLILAKRSTKLIDHAQNMIKKWYTMENEDEN